VLNLNIYKVKVHKKGLIVLPARLRKKYKVKEGSEIVLLDDNGQIILIPRYRIVDLYGIAREHAETIDEMIKEIEEERKNEAST